VVGSLGGTSDGKERNDAESDGEIDRIRKERARADADATKTTIFSGTHKQQSPRTHSLNMPNKLLLAGKFFSNQ
jgi:hypothetical protein